MSRIGKKLILLPEGVEIAINGNLITAKGPKGSLTRTFTDVVKVEQITTEAGKPALQITVTDAAEEGAMWGTARAHLQNMVHGVVNLWTKALELNGVGYKMNLQGRKLVMALGFSHEVVYELPEGVDGSITTNVLTLTSVNRDIVGKAASEIRSLKKPEPYKGKGFRYTDEIIRRKAGKAAKGE